MKRKWLLIAVVSLCIVGAALIIYTFLASLSPPASAKAKKTVIDPHSLRPGEVKRFKANGMPLIVVRPNKEMLSDLNYLNDHVWNNQRIGKHVVDGNVFYVFYGIGSEAGHTCGVAHHSKAETNPGLPMHEWLGGFVDLCRDNNYDYSGRAIRTMKHTFINKNIEVPNLVAPETSLKSDGLIHIIVQPR